MTPQGLIALLAGGAMALTMVGELIVSRRNARALLASGATVPPDEVYATMQWAYPGLFVVLCVEGAIAGPAPGMTTIAGVVVLAASKALKYWAIASLGWRWTFRVIVLPGAPLVTHGPYQLMRHPNYVGVLGEIAGVALLVGARITGPLALVGFALLLRRRIRVEEQALDMG